MARKSLIKGAAIIAAAGFIVKVLGAVFRIPLANLVGSVGMANYSPAYSLYSFLLVFSTAGIPVAISKMVSERYAVGQYREADRVFKLARMVMIILGIICCFLLFVLSGPIANLINVPGSVLSMRATALALLLVPIESAYRGYYQGMQEMVPTAMSEVAEQTFRVIFGLLLAFMLMSDQFSSWGFTPEERGAAGGCFGASAGAVGGLTAMLLVSLYFRKRIKERMAQDETTTRESNGSILKTIAVIAIPITIGAAIMPIVNLIDAGVVTTRLLSSGWNATEAESMYGQLTGFASPIIQFPQVFMTAIVMNLVPMISADSRLNNTKDLHGHISLGLRLTTIIALPSAVGMFILAEPILTLLYASQRESAISAASCLQVYSIGFIFLAVLTTMTGVLQGIGKQHIPVINLCVGVIVKFFVTWTLTAIPAINVRGAAAGSAVAYLIAMILDLAAIKRYCNVKFPINLAVTRPLISSLVMGVIVWVVYKLLDISLGSNLIATLVAIIVGIIVYALMILRTKTIEREEMMSISFGRRIARICDKLKLW